MASALLTTQEMPTGAQPNNTLTQGTERYNLRHTERDQADRQNDVYSQDKAKPPRTSSSKVTRSQSLPTVIPGTKKRKRNPQSSDTCHPQVPSPKRHKASEERTFQTDPIIEYWCQEHRWPREHFQSDEMSQLLVRKKSTASLRRKRSDSYIGTESSHTPSDQRPREQKSAPYRDSRYRTLLGTLGSFMGKHPQGITDESKVLCKQLLDEEQSVPEDTLFRDDLFEDVCHALENRDEVRVIRDISLLLVPSAEALTIRGCKELRCLIESVNEGWNNSIPVTSTRPQPDYSVGFRREAFTEERLQKLQPFVGVMDQSYFMATYYLYFPFLTCEITCGAGSLDITDRQNAHSMTMAVRAIVELFRLVKREKEIDREILAFSVSHDHQSVRIYGHYPVIDDTKTTYYRHPIREFSFTEMDGRDKWTTYRFTKNVYCSWMPKHFERLCSAIDAIPADLDFEVSHSELQFSEPSSGLSQDIASHRITDSEAGTVDSGNGDQLNPIRSDTTPAASYPQSPIQRKSKRGRG